jgi:site-specific recombinase XerD
MLEKFLERLGADQRGQRNPLLVQVLPFADSLMESGYAATTIQSKLGLLIDLGEWLRRRGLAVKDLDERRIETFITDRRRKGLLRRGDRTTVRQLLDHLRERHVVQRVTPTCDVSPLAAILDRYEKHLRSERGLTTATIINYLPFARKFLSDRFGEGPFLLKVVRPCDISGFILRHARTMSCRRAQLMTTAFRSFFRFLFMRGELQVDLAPSIPTVADWRLSTLPRYITAEEVIRVLGSCDRHTATGRRDYALLLLLARLGLRAGEIVAMQLDDIDWRSGEILVRGKGLLYDRMPLPVDVGQALAVYLRHDRLSSKTRRVFVCSKAPQRGFSGPSTVSTIVRRALDRAGLHPGFKGAHLLRHSLATSMIRSGASMSEIGEILRHRSPSTTEIYAKLDFEGLRSLAQPWPNLGGAQ